MKTVLVTIVALLMALPAAAQSTRVDAIAEQQAEKAKHLGTEGPPNAEMTIRRVLLSPLLSGRRALTLGFDIPVWRTQDYFESPAIGRLPRDHSKWHPEEWWPHITNAAFRHMRPDDTFWAATKIAAIDDEMIRAAVAEGRFGDKASEEFLAKAISDRRLRILQTFLPKVNPVVDPELDPNGHLSFRNAAVETAVADRVPGYRALWYTFDNATNKATLVATTEETQSPMLMPPMPASEYIQVDISAVGGPESWTKPVSAYFHRNAGGWTLVGFERQP